MEVEQGSDGLGRDLRGVAGENDDMVVGGERRLRDHQSVASAALLSLQDEIDAGVGDGGPDTVGFVTDDGEDVVWRDDTRGGRNNVSEQWLAADFMQHFGKLRLEPRAFTGGHDGDGHAGSGGCGNFRRRCVPGFLHSPHYTLSQKSTKEGGRMIEWLFPTPPAQNLRAQPPRLVVDRQPKEKEEMPKVKRIIDPTSAEA